MSTIIIFSNNNEFKSNDKTIKKFKKALENLLNLYHIKIRLDQN